MTETSKTDNSRRKFITAGAAFAGLGLAPGVHLIQTAQADTSPSPKAVTSDKRWGMLIDANKCGDCTACITACNKEFGLEGGQSSEGNKARDTQKTQYIRKVELLNKQTGHKLSLPILCQHCESPPCVDVCPTGASMKRADGIAKVDMHLCIGCRYCMMACPYKARSFVHEKIVDQKPYAPRGMGTVESCNLCVHRVDEGRQPACVEACNKEGNKAMVFGDLKDENSAVSKQLKKHSSAQLRADLGLNTGIRYRGI